MDALALSGSAFPPAQAPASEAAASNPATSLIFIISAPLPASVPAPCAPRPRRVLRLHAVPPARDRDARCRHLFGRASCRDRVCQSEYIQVVAVTIKKQRE